MSQDRDLLENIQCHPELEHERACPLCLKALLEVRRGLLWGTMTQALCCLLEEALSQQLNVCYYGS